MLDWQEAIYALFKKYFWMVAIIDLKMEFLKTTAKKSSQEHIWAVTQKAQFYVDHIN